MGNRDALLAAARECVETKGYARTTARDIATAAGVSLAAIGYHFGSTEALLNEAVFGGIQEWAATLRRRLAAAAGQTAQNRSPVQLAHLWASVIESFQDHRSVLAASYVIMARADDVPEFRARLAEGIDQARRALAKMLAGVDPATEPERARQVGSLYYAILNGLLTQWLVDPDAAPTAADLTIAFSELDRHT
jgi:AcrR family transcriptional regulator